MIILKELREPKIWALLILTAVLFCYFNTFSSPFIFDDIGAIVKNPFLRELDKPSNWFAAPKDTTTAGRPLLAATFAANFTFGALSPKTYHLVNTIIHALNAILLGLVISLLLKEKIKGVASQSRESWGWIIALIWSVHPLQTGAVTYVVQRAESLMAMHALLCLYAFFRSQKSASPNWWRIISIISLFAAIMTKESAVVIPIIVVAADRMFYSENWSLVFKEKRIFYVGLFSSWIVLELLLLTEARTKSTGFHFQDLTWWDYLQIQLVAIPHYIKLTLWPHPLILDYWWPRPSLLKMVPCGFALVALSVATVIGLFKNETWSFIPLCFFLLLAPSSSFFPIRSETVAEHRAYLPSALLIATAFLSSCLMGRFLSRNTGRDLSAVGLLGVVLIIFSLMLATRTRNTDYKSETSIWLDTVQKQPRNTRAYNNLGAAYQKTGNGPAAESAFLEALSLNPSYPEALFNLGTLYAREGKTAAGIKYLQSAIKIDPEYANAYCNLGNAYLSSGRIDEAEGCYRASISHNRYHSQANYSLAFILMKKEKYEEALMYSEASLIIEPGNGPAKELREEIQRAIKRGY